MLLPHLLRLGAASYQLLHAALPSCTTCIARSVTAYSSNALDIINKWQGLLSLDQPALTSTTESNSNLHTQLQLRQLVKDAIYIYKSEGAAAVLPDRITDVFMAAYAQLSTKQQRLTFFTLLAREFGVQSERHTQQSTAAALLHEFGSHAFSHNFSPSRSLWRPFLWTGTAVDAAVELWQVRVGAATGTAPELLYRISDKLISAAQPLYMQLLLPVSQHKAGIGFLVQLRADLLQLLREQPGLSQATALRALSEDLRSALARWFSVGLVQLERITWEHTPGLLLERVMCTEAVHHMQHIEELKRRLQQSDRRVFAFLHPSLPSEPLVVLHTALIHHIPASMQEVIGSSESTQDSSTLCSTVSRSGSRSYSGFRTPANQDHASNASVACFYSISSGQPGLSGVDLGNFLIKKAALLLMSEFPQLQHLVTLSPAPGFRAWLITRLQQSMAEGNLAHGDSSNSSQQNAQNPLLQQDEATSLLAINEDNSVNTRMDDSSNIKSAAAAILLQLVKHNSWLKRPADQQAVVQSVLLRLCAVYLLKERRRGLALDPVAHFHLKNGAVLWRINPRADLSAAGLERSCGLMVNYQYTLSDVTANNQSYLVDQVIAAADQVKSLLNAAGHPGGAEHSAH